MKILMLDHKEESLVLNLILLIKNQEALRAVLAEENSEDLLAEVDSEIATVEGDSVQEEKSQIREAKICYLTWTSQLCE